MQQDKNLELFSTNIFVFKFTNKEMEPLINEVLLKKEEIKKRSLVFSNHGGIGDYHTDYRNPIQLHEYEKLMYSMVSHFNRFDVNLYWTAFYNKNCLHDKHLHGNFIKGAEYNYSSVLYLSCFFCLFLVVETDKKGGKYRIINCFPSEEPQDSIIKTIKTNYKLNN